MKDLLGLIVIVAGVIVIWVATEVAALVVGVAFGGFIIYFFVTQLRSEMKEEREIKLIEERKE